MDWRRNSRESGWENWSEQQSLECDEFTTRKFEGVQRRLSASVIAELMISNLEGSVYTPWDALWGEEEVAARTRDNSSSSNDSESSENNYGQNADRTTSPLLRDRSGLEWDDLTISSSDDDDDEDDDEHSDSLKQRTVHMTAHTRKKNKEWDDMSISDEEDSIDDNNDASTTQKPVPRQTREKRNSDTKEAQMENPAMVPWASEASEEDWRPIRIASWNVNKQYNQERLTELMIGSKIDVMAIQEPIMQTNDAARSRWL